MSIQHQEINQRDSTPQLRKCNSTPPKSQLCPTAYETLDAKTAFKILQEREKVQLHKNFIYFILFLY